ncbi:MAG TPA: hypothetical protein VFA06_12390 [Actinocrinis sp.]|uniref:hypothetical protein n=1 Tax=Actinocrinis sp. TaxID=1920516 RepID=UPI002D37950F|nr:hypothetical protein [Actinocrinis sp.]HZU56662.1 hypothetical protein [Actinocrinis sp.]
MAAGGGRMLACCDFLIRRACRRLPDITREEQEKEWVGELPVILADQDVRFAWMRALKMLMFAAGVVKVVHRAPKVTKLQTAQNEGAESAARGWPLETMDGMPAIAAMSSAQTEAVVKAVASAMARSAAAESSRLRTQIVLLLGTIASLIAVTVGLLFQHVSVATVLAGEVGSALAGAGGIVVFAASRRFVRLCRTKRGVR